MLQFEGYIHGGQDAASMPQSQKTSVWQEASSATADGLFESLFLPHLVTSTVQVNVQKLSRELFFTLYK